MSTLKPKIALTGLARSGKDTVAKLLVAQFPELKTYALAQPIKTVINALVSIPDEVAETQKDIEITYSIDAVMQEEAASEYYQLTYDHQDIAPLFHEFWSMLEARKLISYDEDRMVYTYKGSLRVLYQLFGTEFGRSIDQDIWLKLAPEGALITDVRFTNEAQWFLDRDYGVHKVIRDTAEFNVTKHSSELGVDNEVVTGFIQNTGTLESLEAVIELLAGNYKSLAHYSKGTPIPQQTD